MMQLDSGWTNTLLYALPGLVMVYFAANGGNRIAFPTRENRTHVVLRV